MCIRDRYRAVLPEGHQVIIRPSGTEMKVKIYVYAKGETGQAAEENVEAIMGEVKAFIKNQGLR